MPDTKEVRQPGLLVIIARQRSGTTALAETIAEGASVRSFGEVFHNRRDGETAKKDLRLSPEAGFFDFRSNLFGMQPEISYPSVENQTRIFDLYIAHLAAMTDREWILLDIKYNSWHHFEHVYSVDGQAPFLLYLLRQRNAAFAHVVRSSAFARYCSEQFALLHGKWHVQRGATVEQGRMTIDPAAALRDMQETDRQIQLFRRFLSSIPRRIELRYEELFTESCLTQATEIKMERLLDGEWKRGAVVPLQKLTPPLADVVANRDEILSYFEPTTYYDEVAAALTV